MTCFWDGILKSLKKEDFDFIGYNSLKKPKEFITFLKKHKKPMKNVKWQNTFIKNKEMGEYLIWIEEYDITKINDGHLTSVCDPFLLLISELFCINVIHHYNKLEIHYNNVKKNRKTVIFSSNNGHFVYSR